MEHYRAEMQSALERITSFAEAQFAKPRLRKPKAAP